jgi:two-component system chemotaxis response regulator CheB
MGASAGGLAALETLLPQLPAHLPASVFVVVHVTPNWPSELPRILTRKSALPVGHAVDRETIRPGRIYVAPPDRHMLLQDGQIRLTRGPRENRSRPAIDPLFRSAAYAFGSRVVGVVLTGLLDDGAQGLAVVKECGGKTLVQDPEEATWPDMPRSALASVRVDYCLPLRRIAEVIADLARRNTIGTAPCSPKTEDIQLQIERERSSEAMRKTLEDQGKPAQLACPECHGPVWEVSREGPLHFRCEVGHAFTAASLQAAQDEHVERALWAAVAALEDKAAMARRLAGRMHEAQLEVVSREYEQDAARVSGQADLIRSVILGRRRDTPDEVRTRVGRRGDSDNGRKGSPRRRAPRRA